MAERKFGFINKAGQYVIDPMFDTVSDFCNGFAAVNFEDKWGYVDKKGYVVVEPQYDDASYVFSEGLAWVLTKNVFYFIDPNGRKVIGNLERSKYGEVGSFHDGLALVRNGGKYGYIDKTGRYVITEQYLQEAHSFHYGIAAVKREGKWNFMDKTGRFLIPPADDIAPDWALRDGLLPLRYGNKIGYMDYNSRRIAIEPKFEQAQPFYEGVASVKYGTKYGYIDKNGQFVIEPKFDAANRFQDGLASVKYGTQYGFIDKTGQFIIEPKFDAAESFYGGYAYAKNGGKYVVIDKSGQIIFTPQYIKSSLEDFHDGLASVYISCDKKIGYIDKTRHLVINPIYDEAYEFHEGLARIGVDVETDNRAAFQKLPRRQQPNQTQKTPTIKQNPKSGCYIATAVYGSYDCPQVWMLRRFRDYTLDETWYGRAFIRTYYAMSPTLVKWFGATNWFKKLWRKPLDRLVASLKGKGVEDTPYKDKY